MPVDVIMPKDLRQRRRRAGYAAICAVGYEADPNVFRLGTAENVEGHLSQIQPGTWHPLFFRRVVWTPGIVVARSIVTRAETFLTDTGHELGRHWYRAPLDMLDELIEAECVRRNITTWNTGELIGRLRAESDREADRFAGGVW